MNLTEHKYFDTFQQSIVISTISSGSAGIMGVTIR